MGLFLMMEAILMLSYRIFYLGIYLRRSKGKGLDNIIWQLFQTFNVKRQLRWGSALN
jgi:hypothetical protein